MTALTLKLNYIWLNDTHPNLDSWLKIELSIGLEKNVVLKDGAVVHV